VSQMSSQLSKTILQRTLLAIAFVIACAFCTTYASAQIVVPPTPTLITAPEGAKVFLVGHAKGTQGYVCLPTAPGSDTASWTVNSARPEATLFTNFFGQDFQIITHFASPDAKPNTLAPTPLPGGGNATWQGSFDSSRVWAAVLKGNSIPPSPDQPSCPNTGSINCLLLTSIGNDAGPTGGRLLADVTFVQRLNTKGGLAPATGCSTAGDVGKQALVPYTADYYFYHGGVE
jgi:Protein of unknown function (DUF3455)